MALDVRDPRLLDLVDEEAEVQQLATGCKFTEGPLWNSIGRYLLFSDIPANKIRRWDEEIAQGVRMRDV